jgi:potassium/hydrogen antiporter
MDDRAQFDFVLRGNAPLAVLARTYGLEADAVDRTSSAGGLLVQAFGAGVRVGDRVPWGPVELVARTLNSEGAVDTVGLDLWPLAPQA